MEMNWYIDAWAPTEGFVFASHRQRAEDPWERDTPGPITTFAVTAPNFEAQPVDRSVAFGAVRRGFQERFSLDGETEFGFDSLDQLVGFARRVYSGSGPGTMGGGGVEPPPEPEPEGQGDGAPAWFASDLLRTEMRDLQSTGADLLGALHKLPKAECRDLLRNSITPDVKTAASRFLIECAAEAARSGFTREVVRLCHAAACLSDSQETAIESYEFARERMPSVAHIFRRIFDPYLYERLAYLGSSRPHLGQAAHAAVPAQLVKALGLPPKVRTMLDVVSYLTADRLFVARSSQAGLLPLLLAVAVNFRAHVAGSPWYDDMTDARSIDGLLLDCSNFMADWLPIEMLVPALEQQVHAWCRRGPRDQRRSRNQIEEGER